MICVCLFEKRVTTEITIVHYNCQKICDKKKIHTVGYLIISFFCLALAVRKIINPHSKSMKESTVVAIKDKEWEDTEAPNCNPNKHRFAIKLPLIAILT
jgi:hypothetical protein